MNTGSLTAVLFVAAVGTVLEPVTPEAADDAVDAAGTGEEGRAAFRLDLGCGRTQDKQRDVRRLRFPTRHTNPASPVHSPGGLQKLLTTTPHPRHPPDEKPVGITLWEGSGCSCCSPSPREPAAPAATGHVPPRKPQVGRWMTDGACSRGAKEPFQMHRPAVAVVTYIHRVRLTLDGVASAPPGSSLLLHPAATDGAGRGRG